MCRAVANTFYHLFSTTEKKFHVSLSVHSQGQKASIRSVPALGPVATHKLFHLSADDFDDDFVYSGCAWQSCRDQWTPATGLILAESLLDLHEVVRVVFSGKVQCDISMTSHRRKKKKKQALCQFLCTAVNLKQHVRTVALLI